MNLYHIIDQVPPLDNLEIQVEYDSLALELAASGKIRLEDISRSNFVKYYDKNLSSTLTFTDLELRDHKDKIKDQIMDLYKQKSIKEYKKTANHTFEKLDFELSKIVTFDSYELLKVARLFVQSAHPIVIKWLIIDNAEIFISYTHNIGDMMDIESWKKSGENSGMQSTRGEKVNIYVSAGGDPFTETSYESIHGDGWPALCRLHIVAAQELGHFADIMRNDNGLKIGRFSCDASISTPNLKVRNARCLDMQNILDCEKYFYKVGLQKLLFHEETLSIYESKKVTGFITIYPFLMSKIYKMLLLFSLRNIPFVLRFSHEKYFGCFIKSIVEDMKFNVNPTAAVYKNPDPVKEEAIACAESLARIPQQVVKWGHLATKFFMPKLYDTYYNEVIPHLISQYEKVTQKKYIRDNSKYQFSFIGKLNIILSKLFNKKYKKYKKIFDVRY